MLSVVLVLAVATIGLTLAPSGPAQAAVVQWGTNGGQDPNYQATVNGDFVVAGNGVLACSAALVANTGTCADLHSASNANTQNVNDNFSMTNSNTVAGFTTNSSSATLTVPSGATVTKAFLQWSANTGVYNNDTRVLCTAYSADRGVATLPSGSATAYQTQAVQLKVGSGSITSFAPGTSLQDATSANTYYYSATADVTTAFQGVTTGSPVTVSAGNIWAPNGAGCYAGWSLTVVYDYGTYVLGNNNSVPHRIIYYYGHVRENATDAPLTVPFNGFTAVATGTRVGYSLFEGDRNITGDTMSYSRGGSTTYTEIPNSAGATGNIGIGRAAGSVRYTQTADTSAFTNQSTDVATSALSNVVAGDSSVSLRVGTNGDSYLLTSAVLSVPTAGLQVKKTYDGTADIQYRTSSEKATFTITLTNTGAGTLQNLQVSDDQSDCTRTLTGVTLLPLQSTTYTCTAANATTAGYTSTANATATTVVGGYAASGSDATTVALSSLALTKTSALAAGATGRAGDTLVYTFTATNNGQGTLTGVAITDPKFPTAGQIVYGAWPSGTAGTLAAGQSVTATANYVLTQADVDAGSIVNTASTVGTDADGGVQPTATATRTTPIPSAPALSLVKTASVPGGGNAKAGDTVTYGFTATNTGNVTLTGVAISDPRPGVSAISYGSWPSGTTGTLAPGQAVSGTATYVIRQSDVDAGSVKNTATVSGRSPTNATVSASSAQVTVSTVAPAPSIATTKSAAYTSGTGAVGSVVTYTFTARNTGNVTLTGVGIADPHPGLSALTYTWPNGQTAGTLAPGQTVTATATYTVTQADVDAGTIANTATATGTPPTGPPVSSTASASLATAAAAPAITFSKTGAAAGVTSGSTVTYTFTLKNTGNVTLTGATITDPLAGLSAITVASWPSGTAGRLAPGDQVTGTATYALKQSDVDAGSVVNTSTASAAPPTGARVTLTSSATVPLPPTGALSVTKSGVYTSGSGAVGSVIRWDIAFTNTGNVTLSQLALTDSLSGLGTPTIVWPGTAGTLAPGQRATATASYTVTQADVDAGAVLNTASVTGRTPQNASVAAASPQASVATAIAAPSISVTKSGAIAGGAQGNAGDVIRYTFTLRNTGNVTLTGAAVTDPLPGLGTLTYTWPGAVGTLAPGQTATATANYTIKQSDVDAGSVKNTASVAANPPTGAPVGGTSGQVTTATAAAAPSIATTKAGALANGATGVAGDTVNWTITLRNSGNVTLTAVSAADSLAGIGPLTYTWPGAAGTLAPGQVATARGTSTLSQSDVDAGAVSNIATGTGTPPTGAAVTSTGPATVPVAARGALALTKTPSATTGARAGDVITYTFVARNAGNVTLTGVAISDPLSGLSAIVYGTWPSGTTGRLLPGQQVTATATYTITQSDVDAGQVQNTATANGTTPTGAAVTPATASATVTTAAAAPSITTTKTGAYSTGSGGVGSVITYTFAARNSGNVTLTGVAIADPLANLSTLTYSWPGTAGRLLPGQTVTATATYTLTQADVDRGSVVNRATGSGTAPSGTVVTGQSPTVTTATAAPAPAVTLTKSASATGATAGSTVTYTFVLRNTGNVTLTGAAITDPLIGASPIPVAAWPSGTAGTLRVGDQVTGTATYTLKQSDVDAGSVANTATATANPPSGAAVSTTASATVPLTAAGALTVSKSGAYTSGSGAVGSVISWTIVARNTGNVTLTGVAISDTLAGLGPLSIVWSGGTAGTLAPQQTATATASYTVIQADVDAGAVRNTATATGRTPKNATVSGTSPQASVATSAGAPALSLTKTGAVAGGAAGNAGDVITYSFTLRNTGNVTLTGVSASDPLPGLSALTYTWPGTAGTLAPGQTATATASYTIKQADVNAGSVKNTASATGTTPTGGTTSASSGQVTTPTAAAAPSVAVTKSGALATGSTGAAGDTVNWSFTLKNTGNVTLTAASISDSLPGISALTYTWPGAANQLQPGQTATATATYALKQSDVDAGSVANTATGTGTPPTGAAVTSTAPATVAITARPSISLSKTPSIATGARLGDTITYTFVIRNTGTTTLTGVAVADPLVDLSAPVYGTWSSGTSGTLLPGGQVTATATYTVKQTDVDRGSIANTATATGTPPRGAAAVTATASANVTTVAAAPSIATSKSAAYSSGSGAVGSIITYTFTLRNSGNVTLTSVVVSDALTGLGPISYSWPTSTAQRLLPGETATATATYTVTQADVDRGSVVNRATGTGTPPTGAPVTSQSAQVTTATATAAPQMTLVKSGSTSGVTAGSTVTYTFTLTNTGNVTLTGASITDPLIGASPIPVASWPSGTPGTLRVGDQVSATATYTLKQSDVDAGSVVNTATGTATPPSGTAFTRTGSATVPIASGGALTLGKTSAYTSGSGAVGSVITYTFTGRNTGNVTLTAVAINDPHTGLSALTYTWPGGQTAGTLSPTQTVTATATYTVTQADVDRGSVSNTATIAGRTPAGTAVTATSPTVTRATAAAAPSILTLKSADRAGSGAVGDRITYTITSQNTGNVTLTGVVISDPMFTASQLDYSAWPSGTAGTLRPGEVVSATAIRTVTQADVDAGSISNTASSTGTPPTGPAVSDASDTVTVTTATRAPSIALAQSGALQSGSTGRAGDGVTWSFTITNTGNTTLTGVQVAPDPSFASAPVYGSWPSGTSGTLLPGQSVTATATYRLTQADADRGSVTDAATASGISPTGTVTASKPATVSYAPGSSITLSKSGVISSGGGAIVGGTITYTFVARNTGATTLTAVAISDPHAGLSPLNYSWPNAPNVLAPGQSVTATATYTITQQDYDSGSVRNTATVASTDPQANAVTASSDQVVIPTGASTPGLSLTKSSTVASGGAVGGVVTYTFTARNTGNVTLTGVAITDPLPRLSGISYSWPGASGVLAPGATVTATATYTIVQADVDRGYIDNRASVSGTPPTGPATTAASNALRTPTAGSAPSIALTKGGSVTSGSGAAGSTITWTFLVRNTGNVTLSSVGIAEQLGGVSAPVFGAWPGTVGVLAPGQSVTANATYTVTQSDVDAGSAVNTATATGTPQTGAAATGPASATVPLTRTALLTLDKTSSGGSGVGSTISYTFTARNAGTVTLRGVTINDPLDGLGNIVYGTWPSGTAGVLRPGDAIVATATYAVGQADVDRGSVVNRATAAATLPDGSSTSAQSPQVTTTLATADPRLQVTKSPSITSGAAVGDVIRYALTIRNAGNVTVTGITAQDSLPGVADLSWTWPGATGTLAPGETANGTASYRVTQSDVDAGTVINTVTASGTGVRGGSTAPASGSATTSTAIAAPAIAVTDSGALAAGATGRAGDRVTWTYVLTNSGNVTLTGVTATEGLSGATAPVYGTWPGGVANRLAPGQSVTVTTTYTLSQTDVDQGGVASQVTARGTGPTPASTAVQSTATARVDVAPRPALAPVKAGAIVAPGTGQLGDVIRYTLDVTNTGNVTLYRGALVDPLAGLRITSITWPDNNAPGVLPPGTTVHGVGEKTITQQDIDLGYVQNTASTEAYTAATGGTRVTASSNTVVIATAQAAPALTVTKSGTPRAGAGVNDVIDWTVRVVNSGNVTITGIGITDSLALQGTTTTWDGGVAGTLAPGQAAVLRGSTTIVQTDVDAGAVSNTASASGTPARGPATVSGGPASATVRTSTAAPAISVTKSAALVAGATGKADDLVGFSYTVTNTGNTTLTAVQLADAASTIAPIAFGTWPGTTGTLLPGQSVTATAQHRLTQTEVDAGGQSSAVTATATPPAATGVAQVSASATAGVTVGARPGMAVTKVGTVRGSGGVGDRIDYAFSITNTGNVTLSLVDLVDSLGGVSLPVITWPDASKPGILPPNAVATATAFYSITQADVDRGTIVNTAVASGKPPVGDTIYVSSPASTSTAAPAAPALTVTKTASPATGLRVGDQITYTLSALNSGNVTLTGVTASDALTGIGPLTPTWPGQAGVLAPGQTATWTATYRVTQADIDAGSVANSATVSGTGVRGGAASGTASATSTAATPGPSIRVTDSGALAAGSTGAAGDTVTWTYVVTNTGDVSLSAVALTEQLGGASTPVFGPWPAGSPVGTLAPGQSVTATSTYALKQSDVNAGTVTSSVSTRGTPPRSTTPQTDSATASVTIPRRATYTVVKSAELISGTGQAGDTIRYYLTVRNTGNVTLYRGTLLDPLPGLGTQFPSWPDPQRPGTLEPGTGATGYADYPIRQVDVDAGHVDNIATVAFFTTPTGNGTDNRVDVASNPVRVDLVQAAPQLTVTKTGTPNGAGAVGDTISWTVTVRNTGNVTVSAVAITDDLPLQNVSITGLTNGGLAPNATATLTGTTAIAQADVDRGSVTNTAHASGRSARDNALVTGNDASATVRTAATTPQIDITKTATKGAGWNDRAGSTVVLGWTIVNTGSSTLTGVRLDDPISVTGAGYTYTWPAGQTPGTLAPGQRVQISATHVVTQGEVDAGTVSSTATTTGTPPSGAAVTDSDTAAVPIVQSPDMSVQKSGAPRGSGGVGDVIDYTFAIRNTGNVTLTLVDLADRLGGVTAPDITWPGAPGVLLPNDVASATARYTITQADVDAGTVTNQATASGKPPLGDKIVRTSNVSITTVQAAAGALRMTKTATPLTGLTAGSTISYGIRLENTGNVTIRNIAVADALPGISGFAISWPGAAGVLAPGQAASASPTYRVTQDDIDRGSVKNDASATGTDPSGTTVAASATVTSTAAPAAPRLAVQDSGTLAAGSTGVAGDTVTWTYVVTNTGNVTLHGVDLSEAQTGATAPTVSAPGWPGVTGVLAPGQSVTATSTYVLTQADVDAGRVTSTITTTGISPTATTADTSASATAPVTIASRRGLAVVKTGTILAPGVGAKGDTVRYRLEVTNTGNVTVYQGQLLDPLPGLGTPSITWPDPSDPGTLPPGGTVVGVADYALTQADVDRGYIDNQADVEAYTTRAPGRDPANRVVGASNTVRTVTAQARPALAVAKTATLSGAGNVGDTVTFRITTTNSGNVTANGVTVADALPRISALSTTWPTPASPGVLAPGEQAVTTATYVLGQADVDRGSVVNTATASGTSARDGSAIAATSNTTTTPTAAAAPSIAVTDAGALAGPTDNRAGGRVNWTYTLTNTGNVTLTGAQVSDALPGVSAPAYQWTGAPGVLAPGASVTVTAFSTLQQSDVDAGSIVSTVSGRGTPPTGAPATASASATVIVSATPAFTLTKTAGLQTAGRNGIGDTVVFRFTLANPGNVTLRGVTLGDTLAGLSTPVITWPTSTDGVLPPGTTATGTATYQLAQKDIDAGSVSNQATATAQPPTGAALTAQSGVATQTTAAAAPAMTVTKTGALRSGTGSAGSVVRFTIAIRNSGNVTLDSVSLADALPGLPAPTVTFPGGGTSLAPGATATGIADYTLTQADVDRGYVDNTASATATPRRGGAPFSVASNAYRFTTAQPRPSIQATQTAAFAAGQTGVLGDVVDYTFTVVNTGNVTLTGVGFQNTVPGLYDPAYTWPAGQTAGTLAPGQQAVLVAHHRVTQDDVDAGVIRNVLSTSGTSPTQTVVTDAAPELVVRLATATTGLDLTKSGVAQNGGGLGDTIVYTLTLTNSGTATLHDVMIDDGLPGLSTLQYTWPTATAGTLPPGQSVTATGSYTVRQADVDAGSVVNTATASGLDPAGARSTAVSPTSTVSTGAANPAIRVAKTVSLASPGPARAGDTVVYSFDVENTGDVTLADVTVGDAQPGIAGWTYSWPGTPGVLAPGQHLRATARYTLTQADIDRGFLQSTASTDGQGARGGTATDDDVQRLALAAAPALAVQKTAQAPASPTVGSTIAYTVSATNTGNVTLSDVTIADPLVPALTYAWPGGAGILEPGQTVVATGSHTVTQADVDAGAVANTATASGRGPGATGATVSAAGSATVQIPNGAAVDLAMQVRIRPGQQGFAGDVLEWTWTVTNTGTRTLHGVTIADSSIPGLSAIQYGPWPGGVVGDLAPGQSVVATATSVIRPQDEGQRVASSATVSATGATAAQVVQDAASTAIQLPARPVPPVPPVTRPGSNGTGGLAVTGIDPSVPAGLALLLLLWGGVLIGTGYRRRRGEG